MEHIDIIKATVSDISLLKEISIQTFTETFAKHNTEKDLQAYLHDSFSTDNLTKELSYSDSAFCFAKLNDELIGYMKINFNADQRKLKTKARLRWSVFMFLKNIKE